MEAIKAKDSDLAERLADEHMRTAYENMVKNGLFELYGESEEA